MKRKIPVVICLFLLALSVSLVACSKDRGKSSGGPIEDRLSGFTVEAQETVEVGTYYTPKIPTVTLDGKEVFVTVTAKQAGKDLYFNGSGALLVLGFDDVILTFTVAEDGQTATRTTTLKIVDTTAPTIVLSFPTSVYKGQSISYNDYIRVVDLSGESITPTVTITDNTGAAVSAQNGVVSIAQNSTITSLKFSVVAQDSHENVSDVTETTVEVMDIPTYGQIYDFDNMYMSMVSTYTSGSNVTASDVEKTTLHGKPALVVEADNHGAQDSFGFLFVKPQNANDFSSISFTLQIDREEGESAFLMFGTSGWVQSESGSYVRGQIASPGYSVALNSEVTFTIYKDDSSWTNVMPASGSTIQVYVKFRHTNSTKAKLYITDIKFGFGFDSIDGSEVVNLYEKFGTDSENATFSFTPKDGPSAAIANPSAFTSDKSGTIEATIGADGYKSGTWEVAYKAAADMPVYGQLFDFEKADVSDLKVEWASATSNIRAATADGDEKAIAFDVDTTNSRYFGIQFPRPDWYDTFNKVSFTIKIERKSGDSAISPFGRSNWTINDDGEYVPGTSENAVTVSMGQKITVTICNKDVSVWEQLEKGAGVLRLPFGVPANTVNEFTIYITDIEFGYTDITVEEGTELDIAAELGLTDEIIENVKFNDVTVSDITALKPDKSGTLTFTLKKAGYKQSRTICVKIVVKEKVVDDGSGEKDNDVEWKDSWSNQL